MLYIEDALEVVVKPGIKCKLYKYKCISCEDFIYPQSGHLKTHSGKCKKCTQRKRPYEHILNELTKRCNTVLNYDIDLNYEDFVNIIKDSNCHYCGKKLIYNPYSRGSRSKHMSRAYQLDRMDNNKGYLINNVVPCCWYCNRMKSDIYTYEEFIKLSPVLKEIHANK